MIELWVPESHHHCTVDNFDFSGMPTLRGMTMQFLTGELDHGLFMFGDPGIGKSHLAVAIFRELVESQQMIVGQDVLYVSWSDTIKEIWDAISSSSGGNVPENVAERITRVKILIMDDIRPGVGKVWGDFLRRVVEKVYENRTLWVVTANLESMDELKERWALEDYWISRMSDCVKFVRLRGEDRRGVGRRAPSGSEAE